ncbi:nuclear transport factor 2 family protein [Alkaliphilus serpentinus]
MVTKSEYIDYLHLAKVNDEWVIVNVLWDFNRKE